MDDKDRMLLRRLRENAREPVTSLAHLLGTSRSSVYARMGRLEGQGIIDGYTVRIGKVHDERLVRAVVMLKANAREAKSVEKKLTAMHEVIELHAISGEFDMLVLIETEGVLQLNETIDRIAELDGVISTITSILLATKLRRA